MKTTNKEIREFNAIDITYNVKLCKEISDTFNWRGIVYSIGTYGINGVVIYIILYKEGDFMKYVIEVKKVMKKNDIGYFGFIEKTEYLIKEFKYPCRAVAYIRNSLKRKNKNTEYYFKYYINNYDKGYVQLDNIQYYHDIIAIDYIIRKVNYE